MNLSYHSSIYCEAKNISTHFICECCGVGMCDDCYETGTDHINHYNQILDNCDCDRECELIERACGKEPDYICEVCVNNILASEV